MSDEIYSKIIFCLKFSVGLFQEVIYQKVEGIPATTSGLEDREHIASSSPPIPSGDACDGLDENYGCQHEEQGAAAAADETSLEEKVIDADTMPAYSSHVEDAGISAPRFKLLDS